MARNTKSAAKARGPEEIVAEIAAAKRAENDANIKRVALEEELIKALDFDKVEGGTSYEIGDYKVAVVAKLNRKIDDIDDFVASCKSLPVDLRPYDTEVKVSQTALKYLSNNEPELFAKIAKHITTAPAKTSVTLARKI
jgi:hypothetical protein